MTTPRLKLTSDVKNSVIEAMTSVTTGENEFMKAQDIAILVELTPSQVNYVIDRIKYGEDVYVIESIRGKGHRLIGKKIAMVTKVSSTNFQTHPFSEPLPTHAPITPSPVTNDVPSPIDRIMHLVLAMREVDVEEVAKAINVSEKDAVRLMAEAGRKHSTVITNIMELLPRKSLKHTGGFVSKEEMTIYEMKTWHLTMALGRCRSCDITCSLGMSINEATRLMKTVADKCEATICYNGYIKAN